MPWRRILISIALFALFGWINFGLATTATLLSGEVAGRQFENSDTAYLGAVTGMAVLGRLTLSGGVLIALLVALWWRSLRHVLAAVGLIGIGLAILPSSPVRAYYNQSDYAEVYFILPNESAFFIPDVGANKDSQTSFGSEDYLKENKIAAKRFQIPHMKLPGSAMWSNFYVPTGRLIIVDRTPFSREWVAAATRGSSAKDESFPCQSREGLDISVGIAIGASVYEENAAKFLYRFGVRPPAGDRSQPDVIFTSVFYGRSLTEVMDGPVRNKVQSLVCAEFAGRSFEDGNSQANQIMDSIEKKVRVYLGDVGITLDYIGWADTFTFAPVVQDAVNRRFVASQDKEIATLLAPYATTIQGLAIAEALRTKWNGQAPTTVSLWWLPVGVTDAISSLFKPGAAAPPAH